MEVKNFLDSIESKAKEFGTVKLETISTYDKGFKEYVEIMNGEALYDYFDSYLFRDAFPRFCSTCDMEKPHGERIEYNKNFLYTVELWHDGTPFFLPYKRRQWQKGGIYYPTTLLNMKKEEGKQYIYGYKPEFIM